MSDQPSYWASERPSGLPRYQPVALGTGVQHAISMCLGCGALVPAVTRDAHDQWHRLIAELLRGKGSQ